MNREDCLTGITLYKGNTSEAIVLAAYIQAGFLVSLPFGGGAAYDLIVDTSVRLIKVQVKTGKLETGCVVYNARRHRGSKYDTFRSYKEGELDLFAVCCPGNAKLYAIPAQHPFTVQGRLRVVETLNFQQKKIKWARDYSWEKHIASLRSEMRSARG
jgi:hypothetical protein